MREKLKASDLTDLSSLLQRDLNDRRVAQELVPYLLGKKDNKVGFFPAILAVLVPKGYLSDTSTGSGAAKYPASNVSGANDSITNYGDCWETERYSDTSGKAIPLGMLRIVPENTEVIVLDGQHRANAFRYVAGVFKPQDTIYQTFYQEGTGLPNSQLGHSLNAELPITLIWFESAGEADGVAIDPRMISRRLFTDVNNTAKPVSTARNILLDDRTLTAVATQAFYNQSAERKFSSSRFSLLHGAFDMDGDLSNTKYKPVISLTFPEIIESAISWALLSTTSFDSIDTWVISRQYPHRNTTRLYDILPDFDKNKIINKSHDDDDNRDGVYLADGESSLEFRNAFNKNYSPVIKNFFDKLAFLKPHYNACEAINDWAESTAGIDYKEIWDKVFCGGEGLYWNFTNTVPSNLRAEQYLRGIKEIDKDFLSRRASFFNISEDKVNSAFESFKTKAFQIGYVMAVSYIVSESESSYLQSADLLIDRLNSFSYNQWVSIINEFRPLVIPATDPKKWPANRNILLRMYYPDSMYEAGNYRRSPEWKAYENKLTLLAGSFVNTESYGEEDVRRASANALENIMDILNKCGLASNWFTKENILPKGIEFINNKIEFLKS